MVRVAQAVKSVPTGLLFETNYRYPYLLVCVYFSKYLVFMADRSGCIVDTTEVAAGSTAAEAVKAIGYDHVDVEVSND